MNQPTFDAWIGKNYYPVCMYPLGPQSYTVSITDLHIALKLSKQEIASHRPYNLMRDVDDFPRN